MHCRVMVMRDRKRESGSITLEASLIMPIFLSFLLLLITFIRISIVDMALTNTVSEATKQIATHMYPIELAYDKWSQTKAGEAVNDTLNKVEETRNKIIDIEDFIESYNNLLPREIRDLLTIREQFENKMIDMHDQVLSTVFQPIVDHYVDSWIIQLEHFQVIKVTLPNLKEKEPAYFGIEARYDMPLNIPFIDKTLSFKKQAYERVWIGNGIFIPPTEDNKASGNDQQEETDSDNEDSNEDEEKEQERVRIDSITNPVQRGHKVRIIAQGPPNQIAEIQLYYPSGFTKKDTCRFDANGWLTCTQKIGGNTNGENDVGRLQAVIRSGGQQDSAYFDVYSKDYLKKYKKKRENNQSSYFFSMKIMLKGSYFLPIDTYSYKARLIWV